MGTALAVRDEILREGLYDWVSASWVFSTALERVRNPVDARSLAIGVIVELVTARLMVAGSLGTSGYDAWDCSPEDAAARIVREWVVEQRQDALVNEAVWLDITPAGKLVVDSLSDESAGIPPPHRCDTGRAPQS